MSIATAWQVCVPFQNSNIRLTPAQTMNFAPIILQSTMVLLMKSRLLVMMAGGEDRGQGPKMESVTTEVAKCLCPP